MVGGVKAADPACDIHKALGTSGACPATVVRDGNTQYFDNMDDAWQEARDNGGELTVATNFGIAQARTIDKDITINVVEGKGSLAIGAALTIAKGGSLTINSDATTSIGSTLFDVKKGGSLTLNGVELNASSVAGSFIKTEGNVTITGSDIKVGGELITAAKDANVSLDGDFEGRSIVTTTGKASVTVVGGDYTTTAEAFTVNNGSTLDIQGGNIEAGNEAVEMNDAKVTIGNATLTSTTGNTVATLGNAATASLTINAGTKLVADKGYALDIQNPEAKYALTDGIYESPSQKAAISLSTDCIDDDAVVENLQGIISGGSYLTEIVAAIKAENGAIIDVSTQLVKAGVAIETKDGYKVVGEGSQTNTNEQTTAPESQEPTGNTADAKNLNLKLKELIVNIN